MIRNQGCLLFVAACCCLLLLVGVCCCLLLFVVVCCYLLLVVASAGRLITFAYVTCMGLHRREKNTDTLFSLTPFSNVQKDTFGLCWLRSTMALVSSWNQFRHQNAKSHCALQRENTFPLVGCNIRPKRHYVKEVRPNQQDLVAHTTVGEGVILATNDRSVESNPWIYNNQPFKFIDQWFYFDTPSNRIVVHCLEPVVSGKHRNIAQQLCTLQQHL